MVVISWNCVFLLLNVVIPVNNCNLKKEDFHDMEKQNS